jgi:WhiB family redox-sensing transcriptional regulator
MSLGPWVGSAACDVGFGDLLLAEQRKLCRDCPVRSDCLDYAIDQRIDSGVWGGLTEGERRDVAFARSRSDSTGIGGSR